MQSTQNMKPIEMTDLEFHDGTTGDLDLGIQELDEFVAPFDFDDFKEGVAVGAGLGIAVGSAAAIAT